MNIHVIISTFKDKSSGIFSITFICTLKLRIYQVINSRGCLVPTHENMFLQARNILRKLFHFTYFFILILLMYVITCKDILWWKWTEFPSHVYNKKSEEMEWKVTF